MGMVLDNFQTLHSRCEMINADERSGVVNLFEIFAREQTHSLIPVHECWFNRWKKNSEDKVLLE